MQLRLVVARCTLATISVVGALAIAELAASTLHRHAFPYLNIFRRDAVYGVSLPPDSSTRMRSRTGRITEIAINPQGFRGPDWTTLPVEGRVLVLGDSQVFGYGVQSHETLTERLSVVTAGRYHGMAAAIPTWGPSESVLAARDLVPRFRPGHVVFVANLSNDWFESPVPNVRRTNARDGWSSRVLPSSPDPTEFPLRTWLMSQSHLVFAARELASHVVEPTHPPAETARRILRELPSLSRAKSGDASILTHHIRAIQALGVPVSVVILPLDVQVHASEWRKYRTEPFDLSRIEVLTTALLDDLRVLGIPSTDLLEPLRSVSPGAFLVDDDHLSPRGHQAVARVIAAHLSPSFAEVSNAR